MAALVIALVLAAGYATQRGSVCAVAAAVDWVARRRAARLLGFLFCAAVALAIMAAGQAAGLGALAAHPGHAPTLPSVAGGVIFGAGAWANGRCAFGTVARLGSGEAARLATIAGFLAGASLMALAGMRPAPPPIPSPLLAFEPWIVLALALLIALALGAWLRGRDNGDGARWSPLRAMAVIGAVNGALLVLAQGWPYTSLLLDIAFRGVMDAPWRSLLSLAFLAGAVLGGVAGGGFRATPGPAALWLRSLLGGVLMGVGATLVPGGNDAMLLVGLPLLLPNLVLAYVATMLTLIALAALRRTAP